MVVINQSPMKVARIDVARVDIGLLLTDLGSLERPVIPFGRSFDPRSLPLLPLLLLPPPAIHVQ